MRALVTGASGLLGRALVRRLRESGVTVRALVRPGSGRPVEADEVREGDLADPQALTRALAGGVDWVFHAGARVRTDGNYDEFEAVNVRGTADLLRLAREAGVLRFVHVSSLGVLDVPRDGAVIDEDGPLESAAAQRGHYARSKWEADRIARQAIEAGAPVTVVRPGLLYGPGRRPPLGRRVVALGRFRLVLAGRRYLLPLAYVENVADALLLAAERDVALGRVYTIVDAGLAQEEYLRLYREVSGERWQAVFVPLAAVRWAVSALELGSRAAGRRSPITRHQVERTLRSATFVTRRAEEELGWRPRVGVREALLRTLTPGPGPAALTETGATGSVA